MNTLYFICFFTFLIHLTESLTYCMRLAGLRTRQIAISMSFVTSSLLVSRLSNMFQAPLLGAMVDRTVMSGTEVALKSLEFDFRIIIFSAFLGSFLGAFFTPTVVQIFHIAIDRFHDNGSLVKTMGTGLHPKNMVKIVTLFKCPSLDMVKALSLRNIPKGFLIFNVFVAAIYTIGVLCSLLAGAFLPELRSTAIQLSGIVNGMATIMFTMFVDPAGARITDQSNNNQRSQNDVRSVVFFLLLGRILGTLIVAQLFFMPFSNYIIWMTTLLAKHFV